MATLTWLRYGPNGAAHTLNYFADYRQTDSGAFVSFPDRISLRFMANG